MFRRSISLHAPVAMPMAMLSLLLAQPCLCTENVAQHMPVPAPAASGQLNEMYPQGDEKGSLETPRNPPGEPVRSSNSLPPVLQGLVHTGWDDAGTNFYVIDGGRLQSIQIETARTAQTQGANMQPQTSLTGFCPPIRPNELAILREFGCSLIGTKAFRRGNRFIYVEAFQFDQTEGANAGYDLMRKGSTTVLTRGDGSSEDADSVSFWQDHFLFVLYGTSQDDDESKEVIVKFADRLSGSITRHSSPPLVLRYLPVIDRVRGSEKIVMGPQSAGRYFSAPNLSALSIEQARAAAVADYQVFEPARERMKLLFVDYGNADMANRAYSRYTSGLEDLQQGSREAPPALDTAMNFNSTARQIFRLNKSYLLCQLKGSKLILIAGARKSKSPAYLASQIIDR